MSPCVEPVDPDDLLLLMQKGERKKAAQVYVKYVLDVRDAFELCNGQLAALRQYYKDILR